ncbi:hypothetical protein CYLTODRAFT_417091 [Cylindrobasidium torrendii FP15055 ss-10]|uniref:Uncharacterized protein n=1 Tax=Cylindrobasidium torrendii FP15055 ss-10 TaxID=1314674 RepID=A0A0D7BSA6_9AGAR|nr:hypothetical protein CYLTODRAFT_417091 [Cylindrobasidium torrendii FP15055 ss-10]
MGGPNLEIFKFSLYLFVPILALVHFGDPAWYRDNVLPYKEKLFPKETLDRKLPANQEEVKAELARIKARLREKAEERRREQNKD